MFTTASSRALPYFQIVHPMFLSSRTLLSGWPHCTWNVGSLTPWKNTTDQVSQGVCDILEPAADTIEPVVQSRLLSHRQLQPGSSDWPRDSLVGQISSPPHGYVAWARYVLQTHRDVLQAAGVYEAIFASMFDYGSIPPSWVRGVMEFWDVSRNTCWIGPEECTITLWELQAVSGLPLFGHR